MAELITFQSAGCKLATISCFCWVYKVFLRSYISMVRHLSIYVLSAVIVSVFSWHSNRRCTYIAKQGHGNTYLITNSGTYRSYYDVFLKCRASDNNHDYYCLYSKSSPANNVARYIHYVYVSLSCTFYK